MSQDERSHSGAMTDTRAPDDTAAPASTGARELRSLRPAAFAPLVVPTVTEVNAATVGRVSAEPAVVTIPSLPSDRAAPHARPALPETGGRAAAVTGPSAGTAGGTLDSAAASSGAADGDATPRERRLTARRRTKQEPEVEKRAPGKVGRRMGEATPAATGAKEPWWRKQYGKAVPIPVVIAFSRQMASFIEAGIPLLEALEIVGLETADATMRKVAGELQATIQRGGSFSDAVNAHPNVFPPHYRAMVRSSEFTGHLDGVLEQLAVDLERDQMAKRQVKSALTYPVVVLVVTAIAMVVMSVWVLPKFAGMYTNLNADLPLMTELLMSSTDVISASLPYLAIGLPVMLIVARLLFGGTRGKGRRDRLIMKLPVIGKLFLLVSLERFCRVLASLAKAGVALPEAIEMSAASTSNTVFVTRMQGVRETLMRGGGLAAPMMETGLFPPAARQMIGVGEKTGTLANQLGKAAAYYEREVAHGIKKATDLFQPAVIVFVGSMVAFVAIAQVSAMYGVFGQI